MKHSPFVIALAVGMIAPLWLPPTPASARDLRFFLDPKIRGDYVWPCAYLTDQGSACGETTVEYVAHQFCLRQGYMGATEYFTLPREQQNDRIQVQVWTETNEKDGGWQRETEKLNRFTGIECYY
jgi:hypothetical protein